MAWCLNNMWRSRLSRSSLFPSNFLLQSLTTLPAARGGRLQKLKIGHNAVNRNKAIISLGKARKAKDILAVFEKEKQQFNNVNWATTMTQLGRIRSLSPQDPKLLAFVGFLADCLEKKGLQWFGIRQIANVAHALAKKKIRSPGAQKIFHILTTKEHALLLNQGTPQEVANTAWACATLGFMSPNLFMEIEDHAAWLVSEGKPQAVANTAWSCATLGFKSPKLFLEIEDHASWLIKEGTPQNVANTAWSCATLGFKSPNLFAGIEDHAAWLINEGTPQNVANTAWACATLGVKSPNLFDKIEESAAWLINEGIPQGIANTAWACATLGCKSPNLFAKIEDHAAWLINEGTPQNVANTAWACATLGFRSLNLFTEIDVHAAWLVREGTPQAVTNTAWACATLGVKSPNLFAEIEDQAAWLVSEGTPQNICNCCYALVALDLAQKHFGALSLLWNKVMQLDPELLSNEDLGQLAQVFAFCQVDGIELAQPSIAMVHQLSSKTLDMTTSEFQRKVSDCLMELGIEHKVEVSPLQGNDHNNGLLAIDLACIEDRVAIECDGPFHFLYELSTGKSTRCENGATQAKRRFLQCLGWSVVNIDYRDWNKAMKKKRQLEFLRGKLVQAGLAL